MRNNQLPAEHSGKEYQDLFDYLSHTHNLNLLQSEMSDLIHFVNKFHPQRYDELKAQSAVWVKASEFKYKVGQVYHAADWDSKGAGFFTKSGSFKWCDGSMTDPINLDKVYILDESGATDWTARYDEANYNLEEQKIKNEQLERGFTALKEKADKMKEALNAICGNNMPVPAKHDMIAISREALAWKGEADKEAQPLSDDVLNFIEWAVSIAFFDDEFKLWNLFEEGKMVDGQFRFTTKDFFELYKKEVDNG